MNLVAAILTRLSVQTASFEIDSITIYTKIKEGEEEDLENRVQGKLSYFRSLNPYFLWSPTKDRILSFVSISFPFHSFLHHIISH